MSIEINGPKGYEVQYLATLCVALRFEDENPGKTHLLVEQQEDAEFTLSSDGENQHLLLQSKSQGGDVDETTLAEWLTHFGGKQSKNCLLDTLIADAKSVALFITNARCRDQTRGFVKQIGDVSQHTGQHLRRSEVIAMIESIHKSYSGSSSELDRERALKCRDLANDLSKSPSALPWPQIIIWEMTGETNLQRFANELLLKARVPSKLLNTVVSDLLAEIRRARGTACDAMPEVRLVIQGNRAGRMLDQSSHLRRAEEERLIDLLRTEHSLFLSGWSQCGKTQIATALAQAMQDDGVECLKTDNVIEAERFLEGGVLESRLVLLDDPLTFSSERQVLRQRIARLSRTLPKHHYLITTAKLDELGLSQDVTEATFVDSNQIVWHSATLKDAAFAEDLWHWECQNASVDAQLRDLVSSLLRESVGAELLQPGHLRFLARNPPATGKWGNEAILAYARFNADSILDRLLEEDESRRVQFSLGTCAAVTYGMSEEEIQFSLDSTAKGAGMHDDEIRCISMGEALDEDEDRQFPRYAGPLSVSEVDRKHLRKFEKWGYLLYKQGRWAFAHPDYREAFQRRVLVEPASGYDDITQTFRRAFESLSPAVGESACRLLMVMLASQRFNTTVRQRFLEIAHSAAQRSIFPNVRCSLLKLLLTEADSMPDDGLLRLTRQLDDDLRCVLWEGDTPWIHNSSKGWLTDHLREKRQMNGEDLQRVISTITAPKGEDVIPDKVADAINTALLVGDDAVMPSKALFCALLRSRQVFVRADSAQAAVRSGLICDTAVNQMVFEDDSPLVRARAINTLVREWTDLDGRDLTHACDLSVQGLLHPAVAVTCCRRFTAVGEDIETVNIESWRSQTEPHRRDFWVFWIRAMTSVLKALAKLEHRFSTDDFYVTAQDASKHVSGENLWGFVDAWVDWIRFQSDFRSLDDWALSVVDFCFDAGIGCCVRRYEVIRRALDFPSTDGVGMAVADLVDHWTDLSDREQRALVGKLHEERSDQTWLHAIALTRAVVPVEIESLITGNTDTCSLSPSEKFPKLRLELRQACAALVHGWVGYSGAFFVASCKRESWISALDSALGSECDPLFIAAVSRLVGRIAYNGYEPDLKVLWEQLCQTANESGRGVIFKELLACSINHTGALLDGAWHRFLTLEVSDEEKTQFASEIAANLEALSTSHRPLRYLVSLLGETYFDSVLKSHSKGDQMALTFSRLLDPAEEFGPNTPILNVLNALYSVSPPRLLDVHDLVYDRLKSLTSDACRPLMEIVAAKRDAFFDVAQRQSKSLEPFRFSELGWIAPYLEA